MTAKFDGPMGGECPPQFAGLQQAFQDNFADGKELGASVSVFIDGQKIVHLWGGWCDRKKERLWEEETLACVYSSGKAVLAAFIFEQVENGAIDYEAPVADYWPEFAQSGKAEMTLGQMLSHQGGLCGFEEEFDPRRWLDWQATCEALAQMAPLWPPGTQNGYHPQTFGYLAGEVLRRVTGKTVGALLRERKTQHGGNIFCGLGQEELARTAYMVKPEKPPVLGELNRYTQIAFLKKWSSPAGVKREEWAAAEIPASNMHANAVGLAAMLAPVAVAGTDAFYQERCHRDDLVLPFNLSWAAGMMRNTNGAYGPLEDILGHSGFGGSMVLADRKNRLSFAYVPSKMSPALIGDERSLRLIEALYESL